MIKKIIYVTFIFSIFSSCHLFQKKQFIKIVVGANDSKYVEEYSEKNKPKFSDFSFLSIETINFEIVEKKTNSNEYQLVASDKENKRIASIDFDFVFKDQAIGECAASVNPCYYPVLFEAIISIPYDENIKYFRIIKNTKVLAQEEFKGKP